MKLRSILLVALGVTLPALVEASNGAMPAFYGAKGPVSVPFGGDGQTAYRMPSGVAWSLDHKVDLDIFLLYSTTSVENSLNDFDASSFTPAASIGLVLSPGTREEENAAGEFVHPRYGTFSMHIGVYPELGGGGGRSRMRWTTYPDGVGVGTAPLFISTAVSAAYAPTEWISFGLGFALIPATLGIRTLVGGTDSSLNGSPLIAGVPLPGNPTYADFLNILSSDAQTDPTTFFDASLTTLQFGMTASVSFRPHRMFAFGFSYRPRSWAPSPFKGDGELRAEATFNAALASLNPGLRSLFLSTLPDQGTNGFTADYDVEITGLRVPRQVRGALSIYPTDWLLIAFELAWIEWHRAFRRADVKLKNGSNADLNFVLGGDTGTIETLRWNNQWALSGYVAAAVTDDLTLRLGFNLSESPVNADEAGNSPNAAFVGSTVTFGAGYWITDNVELSYLTEIAIPDPDGSGLTTSLTSNFTDYSAFQAAFHFGLSLRF